MKMAVFRIIWKLFLAISGNRMVDFVWFGSAGTFPPESCLREFTAAVDGSLEHK
jgi:hypothetical protein